MSTEFYNRNWRMPKSSNSSKVSNYSMDFDGSSEFINLGNNFNFGDGNNDFPFSLSIWFFRPSTGSARILIRDGEWELRITGGNALKLQLNDSSNGRFRGKSGTFTETGWHHIAATYTGVGGTNAQDGIKIYVDGVRIDDTDINSGGNYKSMHNDGGNTNLARLPNGTGYTAGKFDHLSIFDYALTDGTGGTVNQIAELYGNSTDGVGNPMAITGGRKPIAYYPIGDYAAFNGSEYLVNNGALQDYVFKGDYNEYIDTSFSTPAGPKTISIWFKVDTASGYQGLFFGSNTSSAMSIGAATTFVANIGLSWFANYTGVKQHIALTTGVTTYQDGKWHNMTYVYDGSTKFIYIDGQSQAITYRFGSGYSTDTSLDLNFENIKLGSNNLSGATDVLFSNVQIFNTALSATGSNSVETIYNNGAPLSDMSGFTSLQGWWKLDASATFDGSNWSIPDDSSNSNTGTSNGMTAANLVQSNLNITQPYSRYALDFDSTNDYIDTNSTFNTLTSFSISVWFKADDTAGTVRSIVSTRANGLSTSKGLDIYISANVLTGRVYDNGATEVTQSFTDTSSWHNVVMTYNGTTLELFLDNSSIGTSTGSYDSTGATNLIIGKFTVASSYYFDGQLSNCSIWNAALTSTQVTELYNEGKPSNLNNHSAYSNLVSWWQLGENSSFDGTNWTVLDEKGTNNGTSANMTEADLVNGVGTSANGLSDGMGGADNIIGDAPYSTANAVSYGMGVDALSTDVPS